MWSRPGGFGSAPGRDVAVKPKESGFKKMRTKAKLAKASKA